MVHEIQEGLVSGNAEYIEESERNKLHYSISLKILTSIMCI